MAKSKSSTKRKRPQAARDGAAGDERSQSGPGAAETSAEDPARRETKQALVLALLQRHGGATQAELVSGDRLAAPHHPGGTDAPAPERPRAGEGEAGHGRDLLPGRPGTADPLPQGRLKWRPTRARGLRSRRDRASARSRPRGLAGALAQPDRKGGPGASPEDPAPAGARLPGPGRSPRRPRQDDGPPPRPDCRRGRAGPPIQVPVPDRVGFRPGTLLVRDWEGTSHRVMVMADGFAWNGTSHPSLSKVARAITGTRWNGPRFFGLRDQRGKDG